MNLVLLEPHELEGDSVELRARRARHLLDVLRVQPGARINIGIVDGPFGEGEVIRTSDELVALRCTFEATTPPATGDVLLLAVPRPRMLLRCLEDATAFGFTRIVLFRSWKVEKSLLGSRAMDPATQREHLLLGLEQSRRTRLPEIVCFPQYKPFIEDRLVDLVTAGNRFVADPDAIHSLADAPFAHGEPWTLAVGPEGGFLPYEVEMLVARGFVGITLGEHPLRVPAALAALAGQVIGRRAGARDV